MLLQLLHSNYCYYYDLYFYDDDDDNHNDDDDCNNFYSYDDDHNYCHTLALHPTNVHTFFSTSTSLVLVPVLVCNNAGTRTSTRSFID